MITQALSYSIERRATPSQPRTGKEGLRSIDFLRLIDARLRWWPQAKRASLPATRDSCFKPASIFKRPSVTVGDAPLGGKRETDEVSRCCGLC